MATPTLQEILVRSATEPDFRARLTADPHAVAVELGITLPEGIEITVLESTPDHMYLALPPPLPVETVGELDDEALAGVVGGAPEDWQRNDDGSCANSPTFSNTKTGERIEMGEYFVRKHKGTL